METQQAELSKAADTLRSALSRIDDGERLDAATLCSLIEHGKTIMTVKAQWDDVSARYLSDAGKAEFAAAPYPEGFDQTEYTAKWAALGSKIKSALPLDPASDAAQALLAEWRELLAPFAAIATPTMMQDVSKMYSNMPNWGEGAPDPGFDHEVWTFVQAASKSRA